MLNRGSSIYLVIVGVLAGWIKKMVLSCFMFSSRWSYVRICVKSVLEKWLKCVPFASNHAAACRVWSCGGALEVLFYYPKLLAVCRAVAREVPVSNKRHLVGKDSNRRFRVAMSVRSVVDCTHLYKIK